MTKDDGEETTTASHSDDNVPQKSALSWIIMPWYQSVKDPDLKQDLEVDHPSAGVELTTATPTAATATMNNSKTDEDGTNEEDSFKPPLFLVQLSESVSNHPASVLALASVPFFAGAYFGFKSPASKMESLVGKVDSSVLDEEVLAKFGTETERRAMGLQTASRALRVATLSSVGTFGLIGAAIFYSLGYNTVDDAIDRTTKWATSYRKSFEKWLGMEETRPSQTHPEVVATRGMTEDQEWDYLYERYIRDETEIPGITADMTAAEASQKMEQMRKEKQEQQVNKEDSEAI